MKYFKNYKILIAILIFCFSFCLFQAVNAGNLQDAFKTADGNDSDILDKAASTAGFDTGTESGGTDIMKTVSTVTTTALSFLGIIFMGLIIYGGFLWMTDQGNEEQVKKARDIIISAVIGLIIVLSAYAVSWFVINALSTKTIAHANISSSNK